MTQLPQVGAEFGRYRIDSLIGVGGMGVVFAATDTQLKRQVALKVVSGQYADSAEFVTRLEREAEAMARVDSPHIVQIFDHGTHDGCPFIASQYVGGGDLGLLIKTGGALPPQLAIGICAQVANALHEAHRVGVVHRDVKPSNVLLRDPEASVPHAYLCDFGIAQTEAGGLTKTGGIAGSWGYLAPERAKGQPATPSSDIYSLGCLLWACLTGSAPYGGSDIEVALAHQHKEIPQVEAADGLSRALNVILARSMAKVPTDRYPSAADLEADLIAAGRLPDAEFAAPAAPGQDLTRVSGRRTGTEPKRRGLVFGASGLVLALVAAGLGMYLWLRDDDDAPVKPEDPEVKATVTADFTGDSKGDLTLISSADGRNKRVGFASTGSGFASPTAAEWTDGTALWGDIDEDGRLDLVSADGDGFSPTMSVRVGYSDGRRRSYAVVQPAAYGATQTQVLGDFDGDGKLDLALALNADEETFQIWMLRNNGERLERPKLWFTQETWTTAYDVVRPGDFNQDGKDDLAVFRDLTFGRDRRQLTLLTSSGAGLTPSPHNLVLPDTDAPYTRPVTGDFDGDGRVDLALVAQARTRDEITIHHWGPNGFDRGTSWYDGSHSAAMQGANVAVGDYDGNGSDDLALVHDLGKGKFGIRVQLSTGTGFSEPDDWASYDLKATGDSSPLLFPVNRFW